MIVKIFAQNNCQIYLALGIEFLSRQIYTGIMENEDLINVNEWVTADQAVARLSEQGVAVDIAQLYQRAAPTTRRRRVAITSREVFGRLVLFAKDVDAYGETLRQKRKAKQSKARTAHI
jgi:hypothetical protein